MHDPNAPERPRTLFEKEHYPAVESGARYRWYRRIFHHDALEAKTNLLCDGLEAAARDAGIAFTTQRVGGMFGMFFSAGKVDTFAGAVACDTAAFNRFFHAMLERGVFLAPSAFEAGFMSSAHDDAVIAATVDAARGAFASL